MNCNIHPRRFQFNLTKEHLDFEYEDGIEPEVHLGDARNLDFIENNSIDLVVTHPPYANIIHYSEGTKGDLSHCDIPEFLSEMKKVAGESYRVLKPGKFCSILMGDTRRKGHVIPLAFDVMKLFEEAGFHLKEIIIKEQHNCSATGYWKTNSVKYNFLLLAHEYLFVFKKEWTGSTLHNALIPFKKMDSFTVACPKCHAENEYLSGIRMEYSSLVIFDDDEKAPLKRFVSASIYKTTLKKLSEGWRVREEVSEGSRFAYGWKPYYCPKCKTLEMKFTFILEKDGKFYFPKYKCSSCKSGLLKVTDDVDESELFIRCGECGELFKVPDMYERNYLMWD